VHDAQLYGVQVANRAQEGFFDQDLFFLYGSQDSYSAFSILLAPLASTLGLSGAFFLGYVASMALLIFAEMRLVRALIPDRTAGNVALILLVVADLPWGGWGLFRVHESFLTPRIPAVAFTLLGLEQLLQKRFLRATALMLLAMALHPLMAVGGLLLAVASACTAKLSPRAVLAIGATMAVAAAVVVLCQPLGTRLFGYIDPEWYDIVRRRTPFNFPADWSPTDWWRIAYSLAVVLVGCRYLDRHRATSMRLLVLLAVAAVAVSVATNVYPYALLLKGQPHRALWLLQFCAVPLGVLVMFRLWQKGTTAARLGSAFVLCFTTRLMLPGSLAGHRIGATLAIWLSLLAVFALIFHGAERRHRPGMESRVGWLCSSVLASLAATGLLLSLVNVAAFCLGGSGKASFVTILWLVPSMCSDAVVALAAVVLIAGLWSTAKGAGRVGLVAAALWVGFSGAAFFLQLDRNRWNAFAEEPADVAFARQFIQEHRPERDRAPSVYWPTDPSYVWFDVPGVSFYSYTQTAGVVFSRGTAVEGQRRALLVRRFEIDELRRFYDPTSFRGFYAGFYRTTIDEPGPTRQDLIALCNEEQLDFVVLPYTFQGLVAATNGTVWVYDCRSIRSCQSSVSSHQSTDN
jgi:hypothetical protein